MSFEGFDEYLCVDGHYWAEDCYYSMYNDSISKCPKCKKEAKYTHLVDQTNGEGKKARKKIKKKISGYCSCCGEEHICEITYELNKKDWRLIE